MSNQEVPELKRPKGRSPNYPAIDLEEAIAKVRLLYKAESQHEASVGTVVRDWNYKTLNGPAALALGALKRFGLTNDEGLGTARRIRVSDLALDILENPDEEAKIRAIHTAALSPPIHQLMWDKFGAQLPSDVNLKWYLTKERGFTDTGAKEFISKYKNTIAYASSFGPVKNEIQDPSSAPEAEEKNDRLLTAGLKPKRQRLTGEGVDVLTIPMLGGQPPILIEGVNQISEENWKQFMAVLNVMKPSLIRTEDEED